MQRLELSEGDSVGDREVLLVKRFDRHVDAEGRVFRALYASAHTVLRLDAQARGERQRSYVALAWELERWCGRCDVDTAELKRELWRRMAFNAVCGKGDDHPRIHGLLYRDRRWGLSEEFDIAACVRIGPPGVWRHGSRSGSTHEALLCTLNGQEISFCLRYVW